VANNRARIGFFAILLGYFAIILDGSVLNVAIPAIRRGLDTPMAGAQWVLNGYTLTLAALLLTAGALGDRFGLRRMLLAGVLLFTAAMAVGTCLLFGLVPALRATRVAPASAMRSSPCAPKRCSSSSAANAARAARASRPGAFARTCASSSRTTVRSRF